MRGQWNHNTHYHRFVLRALPKEATRALDVGCGEGDLLAELGAVVPETVGLDADAGILRSAAEQAPQATLIRGDFLTYPFEAETFDAVVAVASLHHMDMRSALTRMRELIRPGGVVVVVGLAQPHTPTDYLLAAAAVIVTRVVRLCIGYKEVKAPTAWPAPHTYAEVRRVAAHELPGCRVRRRLFFRYTLTWAKSF